MLFVHVPATLLALLRNALQLNLVTEQSDTVQETRALVKELFDQVATNVELVFDQVSYVCCFEIAKCMSRQYWYGKA